MKPSKSRKNAGSQNKPDRTLLIESGLLALACLVAYQPILSNNLIDWDDLKYITENPITRNLSWDGLIQAFTTPVMGNYHPLTMISLAVNYKLSGDSAFAYHFTNLLFHILNSIWVIRIGQALGLDRLISRTAAVLFALHPLHVESVAWAAERKDVLYTFGVLLAWWCYLKSRNEASASGKWYSWSLLAFVGACLSKGMAVTLPVLLFAGDWLQSGKSGMKASLVRILPFALLSVVFGFIAIWAQGVQGGMDIQYHLDPLTRWIIALRGYWFYLQQTFVPIGLSAIYPYPATSPALPTFWYIQAAMGVGVLGAGMILGLRNPRIFFVWLGYTGVIFPVLQWLPVGDAVAADRYFYLASLPIFFGIGIGYQYVYQRWGKQVLQPGWLVALVLGGLTWFQSGLWKDEVVLFGHSVKHYPDAPVAWNNIGAILQRRQQFGEAIQYYEKAISLRPDYTIALCNLGISYGRTGNMEKAISLLQRSIASDSTHAESFGNLGNAYIMTGRREEALQLFQRSVSLNPRYVEGWYNLGIYFRENRDPKLAVKYFRKSVEARPVFPEGWWSLSAALFEAGDQSGAIEAARKSAGQGNGVAAQWLRDNKLQ